MEMELELGLGLPCSTTEAVDLKLGDAKRSKKRRFEEAFEEQTTLPLFDDGSEGEVADSCNDNCKQVFYRPRTKELVGWPPVKCSWTKGSSDADEGSYVKVTMEGVVIGRKVDLSLHHSYEDLFNTLDRMFPYKQPDGSISSASSSNHHHHMVTYEDEDGDWMLIGDLPWEVFVKSVKRIKIVGLSKQEETARNY
ncbi:Auxin-responsive protein [Rhynchospora pubera]|uniref:Auxin-responsive protein n=1 Tax=Rhynchospora pubera TaxID=906938 RepID=A0AAV8FP77_9POAL|nr:Auxin-responsive protein [Rhynchospora pubera]